jgi:hypothetical protein
MMAMLEPLVLHMKKKKIKEKWNKKGPAANITNTITINTITKEITN